MTEVQTKTCTTEGCENEAREYAYTCLACHRAYQKAWRDANPERHREAVKRYREANLEKITEWARDYYEQNREQILAQNKAYREANPEKVREYQRKWREANEGHIYTDTTSGYVNYIGYQHPATNPSGITRYHRIVLWDKLGGKDANCNWCEKPLTWSKKSPAPDAMIVDHVNNIKDDNRPENLVPSCNICNITREGGQNRKKISGECFLDFCDRDAHTRSKTGEAVCHSHYAQEWRGAEFTPIAKRVKRNGIVQQMEAGYRECLACNEVKPISEYYIRNGKPKGPCKKCEIKRVIERRNAKTNNERTSN